MSLEEGSRITLMAPKIRRKKASIKTCLRPPARSGFVRIRVNGEILMLDEIGDLDLNKKKWHYIELVVDRLIIRPETETSRVAESVETALREGEGVVEATWRAATPWSSRSSFLAPSATPACRRSSPARLASIAPMAPAPTVPGWVTSWLWTPT